MGINAVSAQILKPVTSTTVGVGAISAGGTTRRIFLTEFLCGSDAATLGTSNFRWELTRSTSAATGTSVSATYVDGHALGGAEVDFSTGSSPSFVAIGNIKSNLTANGTLTSGAIMLTLALAQQATFRWVANPGFEIVIPAISAAGIHFLTPVCAGTPSVAAHITCEDR